MLTILHTMKNMKTIESNFFSFKFEKSVLEKGYMSFKSQQFLLCKCVLCIKLIAFIMYVKLIVNHTELVVIIGNVFAFFFFCVTAHAKKLIFKVEFLSLCMEIERML